MDMYEVPHPHLAAERCGKSEVCSNASALLDLSFSFLAKCSFG